MAQTKVIQGSGLNDETENEFYRKFNFELNGQLGDKKLDCHFKRRKDIAYLHPATSYLIVRAPFKRSEKVLSALAKGIWILHEAFIRKVLKEQKWIDPTKFDIGNDQNSQSELHFPFIGRRRLLQGNGGMFGDECVVVLIRDNNLKEKYRRILEAGGAKVLIRTVQHLVDRPDKELSLVVAEPATMLDPKFQEFYHKNVVGNGHLDVVSTVYVEECLTSACKPNKSDFDVLQTNIIKLHEEHSIVHKETLVHNTRRSGSPDIFIDPRHVRHRLKIQSRHYERKDSPRAGSKKQWDLRKIDLNSNHKKSILDNSFQKTYNQENAHGQNSNHRLQNESNLNCSFQQPKNLQFSTMVDNGEDDGFEENLMEIIIDLDEEVEGEEIASNQIGGDSPTYEPNSSIKVSDEDQRVFFGKKAKLSKIKTEARKQEDKHYVNQVRLLKEKAEELKRLAAKSFKTENTSKSYLTHCNGSSDIDQIRRLKEAAEELKRKSANSVGNNVRIDSHVKENIQLSTHMYTYAQEDKHRVSGQHHRNKMSPETSRGIKYNFGSGSTSMLSNLEKNAEEQLPHQQKFPNSSFFDNLILNACSNVQKNIEKDLQKKRDVDRQLLQSSAIVSREYFSRNVDDIVDKHVGLNSSGSILVTALANHQTSNSHNHDRNGIDRNEGQQHLAATPPYQPATPPRLEELDDLRTNDNIELVCLSSDDEY